VLLLVSIGEYDVVFPAFVCVKSTVAKSQPGLEFKHYVETNDRDKILFGLIFVIAFRPVVCLFNVFI